MSLKWNQENEPWVTVRKMKLHYSTWKGPFTASVVITVMRTSAICHNITECTHLEFLAVNQAFLLLKGVWLHDLTTVWRFVVQRASVWDTEGDGKTGPQQRLGTGTTNKRWWRKYHIENRWRDDRWSQGELTGREVITARVECILIQRVMGRERSFTK